MVQKLTIRTCRGRLLKQYPSQNKPQDRYIEVNSDGDIDIDWNAEIGNAVLSDVYHNRVIRIRINFTTKKEAKNFVLENIELFRTLVDGMRTRWNGSNYVGVLTDEASDALADLRWAANELYDSEK